MPNSVLVALYDIRNPPRYEGISVWIASQAIRSAANDYELFLEGCGLLLSKAGVHVNLKKVGSNSLRDRLDVLSGAGCPTRYHSHILSYQSVRNCIVHRDGVVGLKDVGSEGDLRWKLLRMTADVSHPTKTTFTVLEREIGFPLGRALSIGPDVVNDALLTLWYAAQDLAEKVFEAIQGRDGGTGARPILPGINYEVTM